MKPIRHVLSKESFVLIAEAMQEACKEFGLDKDTIIEDLTDKKGIEYKKAFTYGI